MASKANGVTTVFLTPEFIKDIQESKHANMAKQAFSHIFDEHGAFKPNREDHQYGGIQDGWIRWVQMGGVGLRVIYIRKANKIYLYRLVGKSDEDGLSSPKILSEASILSALPPDVLKSLGESPELIGKRLLHTTKESYLNAAFRQMYHLPQKEIVLLTPTVSPPLFAVSGEIGRFLDRSMEDGARVILVTLPPAPTQIAFFEDLARRNIEIYFKQNLRTRLYLFRVDPHRSPSQVPADVACPTAVLGSAELTHQSLDMGALGRHEELCYRFPESHFPAFYNYAEQLVKSAIDLQGHKIQLGGTAGA